MRCDECGCEENVHSEDDAALMSCVECRECSGFKHPKGDKVWLMAHCYSCDWEGYTDNLDDACYFCGEYESLKEVPSDCNRDANHAEFC